MDDDFQANLLRLIASQTTVLLSLQASRDLYGKSYFSLGPQEKVALDRLLFDQTAANYQALPDVLRGQPLKDPVGFQATSAPKS